MIVKPKVITLQPSDFKTIQAYKGKKVTSIPNLEVNLILAKIETDKISIVDIKENNSLLIIGSNSNIKYLSEYIKQVDKQDSLTKREVKVIPLRKSPNRDDRACRDKKTIFVGYFKIRTAFNVRRM